MHQYSVVYIITNQNNTVLYTGITSDIVKRIWQHKNKYYSGFSKKYNLNKLVYYEIFEDITLAITREKQIKAGSRQKKINLIELNNKNWNDIYNDFA